MKPKSTLLHFLAIAGSSLLAISSASAATYYWDGNDATSGFGSASGTWADPTAGTLTSGWSTSSTGVTAVDGNSVSTTTADSVNFGTNTVSYGLAAGTINISGTVNASSITFGSQSGAVELSGGTINLAAAGQITLAGGAITINSVISGAGTSLTKVGNSQLTLTGLNTYTGATRIGSSTGGYLAVTNIANGGIASGIGASSSAASNLVLANDNFGGLNYIGSTNASTDRNFTIANGAGAYFGAISSSGTGTLTFTSTNAVSYITTNGARNFQLAGSNTGQNTLNARLVNNGSGALTFVKSGTGTWVLGNETNSYTGATSINGGVLSVSKMANYGTDSSIGKGTAGTAINFDNSGALVYTGSGDDTDRLIQGNRDGVILNNGTGALNFTATGNLNVQTTQSIARGFTFGGTHGGTISGAIQNNTGSAPALSITKTGTGTWTLGGTNTYTGTTTLNGGRLVLDYAASNTTKLANGAALTLGGGDLELSGGSHTEVVASTTLTNNTGTRITQTNSGASVLQLGTITRSNGGSTLSFSADNIATTTNTNVNGILGPGYTVGSHWAVNSTNGANGAIVALSTYTTTVPTSGGVNTANYQLTGDQTQTGDLAANTLRIVNGANDDELSLGTRQLNLTSSNGVMGAFIYAGGFNDNYTISGTTGIIKAATGNNHLGVNVFTGTLTVNALFNTGSATTTKWGAGTLVVGSNNSALSGAHYVQEGTLRLANNGATGTTAGGIVVSNGAALELSNSVAIGAEALTISGHGISNAGALRNVANNTSSYAGAITIGTGGARINSDSGGSLTLSGGVATSPFYNVTFGGAGNTTVSAAAITGSGSVIKDGAGTLTLSAANTYSGATTVSQGTLTIGTGGSINSSSGITIASGAHFKYNSSTALTTGITNNGGRISGSGNIGVAVALNSTSDIIAPGNSPGFQPYGVGQTWSSFTYEWETNNFTGTTAGTDFDQITITGALSLTGAAAGSYILDLISLDALNAAGTVPNFSETNRSWDILTATGGITGFDASYWTIDHSTGLNTFTSSPAWGGTWSLSLNDTAGTDSLILTYTAAVPEPGAALIGSLGLLALLRRRR